MTTVFDIGEIVQLSGLKSKKALNGATGTIAGDSDYESRGRYTVQIRYPVSAMNEYPAGMSLSPLNLIKLHVCARPGCDKIGANACSKCMKEFYCSGECQETDWKSHKMLCLLIKLLSNTQLPFRDVHFTFNEFVDQNYNKIAKLGKKNEIRLLKHLATFLEHQFGKRIAGERAYERNNGDRLDNWEVEID
jgi:hypothetical protein